MNGCDPFMYSMPPSYGGVVGVGRSSCNDRLDLTLRLGLPSYDEPDFKSNGNTDIVAMAAHMSRFGTYHDQYSSISYQCPCPQLGRQGWNSTYGGSLSNPNPYGGGWPYGANQTASLHYPNSNDDTHTGAYYHSTYTYGGSSSSVPPVSNVSNGTLSRPRTTHDQDAVSSNVDGSRKKYAIRSEHMMTAPEEVDRRCTKCDSNDTPMWRKGPLGPKTLCNACGIKYRKDMEKKKVEELVFAYGGRYQL